MRFARTISVAGFVILATAPPALAQLNGQHIKGGVGLKSGSPAPPGVKGAETRIVAFRRSNESERPRAQNWTETWLRRRALCSSREPNPRSYRYTVFFISKEGRSIFFVHVSRWTALTMSSANWGTTFRKRPVSVGIICTIASAIS